MSSRRQFIPRPITDRAFWDAVRVDPSLADFVVHVEEVAANADSRPAPPSATDFLAARRDNNRGVLDTWWRLGRTTLSCLAMRRLLRGIDAHDPDDTLLNWLWTMSTQPTWAVSAHLPGKDLPADDVAMDLATCEMAADLAEMALTLGSWMDSVSDTLKERVLWEIDRRCLGPYSDPSTVCWWDNGTSNWSGVCAGSMLAACEAMARMGRPYPPARQRALDTVGRYIDNGFTEHGECDEGVSYWTYGVSFAMHGLMRLSDADYDAHVDHERLRQIASYPQRAHLFGQTFYAGNDANSVNEPTPWLCETLALAEGVAWLRSWPSTSRRHSETWSFAQYLRLASIVVAPGRSAPFPNNGVAAERLSESSFLPDQQVAILRSPRMIAILEGGHNDERHNHNDVGSFQIFVDDTAIVPDLGNVWYTADYFTDKRYVYLAASSRGHNCPIIDGHEQRSGREASAVIEEWDEAAGVLSIEASSAYPAKAALGQWRRTLRRSVDGFSISDTMLIHTANCHVAQRVWSTKPVTEIGRGLFHVGPLVLTAPGAYRGDISKYDGTAESLRAYGGATLYCLDLSYEADDDGRLSTEMVFTLGAAEGNVSAFPE